MWKKIINKLIGWNITHNFILNNFLVFFKLDRKLSSNPYLNFKVNTNKSVQENAGYSVRNEINEVLEKSKKDLVTAVKSNLKEGDTILDIGCGPGMYLSLFKNNGFKLFATDINPSMINSAKQLVPEGDFICGNFLEIDFNRKFNFIYCIGVLIYIPPSQLKDFLNKICDHLLPGGILYLNYPHALSLGDVLFKDITYVQYSPNKIEKCLIENFEILKHEHAFDGRHVGLFDPRPYKSLNPNTNRTYKNSYLLIAKRKL